MSFYHTYRSNSFDSLVWQRHIIDVLQAQIKNDSLNHCYLFYGPRWTWKTSTARLLAKAINVPDFIEWNIENDIVKLIDEGRTLDYVEIDAASHTGVDNIREEIIEKALYTPSSLKKKVYVIDEVHMLSKWAFNALLKIMEEPPEYLLFILATTEIHKVPDTIISRCQVFNFRNHTIDDISGHLAYIATQEKIPFEEEWLRMIAKLSQGWMRDAIKYLEQVSILWSVTPSNVSTFLWVVPHTTLDDIVNFYKNKDVDWLLVLLSWLSEWWTDMLSLIKDLLLWCDEHFLEDAPLYAELSWLLTHMYWWVKGSPVPLVVMKSQLWKAIHSSMDQSAPSTPKITDLKKRKKSTTKLDQGTQDLSTSQDGIGTTSRSVVEEKKVEKKEEDIQESSTQEEIVKKEVAVPDDSSSPSVDLSSFDISTLKEQLLPLLQKKMVISTIDKYGVFTSLEDTSVTLVIIHQQFFSMINKPEIIEDLTKKISSLVWRDVGLKLMKMTKEELLQMQMWG